MSPKADEIIITNELVLDEELCSNDFKINKIPNPLIKNNLNSSENSDNDPDYSNSHFNSFNSNTPQTHNNLTKNINLDLIENNNMVSVQMQTVTPIDDRD